MPVQLNQTLLNLFMIGGIVYFVASITDIVLSWVLFNQTSEIAEQCDLRNRE